MDTMKTPDATAALATRAEPSSAASALGDIEPLARAYGEKWRLNNADGTWRCVACDAETAFHASLHCPACLPGALARAAKQRAFRKLKTYEEVIWEGMARNIAKDSRVDRDTAVSIIAKARKLPSSTPERLAMLEEALERRFDNHPAPGRFVVEYDQSGPRWDNQEGWGDE